MLKYPGIVQKDEKGYLIEFPDLKGCFSRGGTMEELISNANQTLSQYLKRFSEDDKPTPSLQEGENVIYITPDNYTPPQKNISVIDKIIMGNILKRHSVAWKKLADL